MKIHCREASELMHMGFPQSEDIKEGVPVVVVMSPLVVHEEWLSYLNIGEIEVLQRARHPHYRAGKLAVHALLRLLLARVDGASPSEHSLERDKLGRPRPMRLPGWSCSLSHDEMGVAVAVGTGAHRIDRLGVDVCRPLVSSDGLSFVLHDDEKSCLRAHPTLAAQTLGTYWACKEALLKRWGWGLIPGLHRINTVQGTWECSPGPVPKDADPASDSSVSYRLLENGTAIAVAHRPDQVPMWWRSNPAVLDCVMARE